MADLEPIARDVYRFRDTCNVYVLRAGREAALVDFGAGDVLPRLAELGVERVTDVLLTHHHRDQGQGLARAVEAGACVWVPHTERDLFEAVDAHWQAREVANNYNVRQDRFSLLEPVPVAGTLRDYETRRVAGHSLAVVPLPGHTPGSIGLRLELDGRRLVFSGDLIAAPGKVWSLAATQWTYNGAEGVAASIASLLDVRDLAPDALLPSHGDPISPACPAIDLLVERLWHLLRERNQNPRLFALRAEPYVALTPHLLRNRTSEAIGYVLLADDGHALLIDYGYDFMTGQAAGADRASRRPWLYTLPALKRDFGVTSIDAVVPTHYHDDHVAGANLLREVEGAEVWAAASFAAILEQPERYDLPCLWYDPIPVDRRLPLEEPIRWREYELTLYPQPGHTRYAVAIALTVDGVRALATGDQYEGNDGTNWNYVYSNRFDVGDYRQAAEMYRRLAPELILPGHWEPLWVSPGYLDALVARGELLEQFHRDLLPLEMVSLGSGGVRLEPYQATVRAGEVVTFELTVRNPYPREEVALIRPVVPTGWTASPAEFRLPLPPDAAAATTFQAASPAGLAARRVRVGVDVTLNGWRLGQQAEALVTVKWVY